MSQTFETPDPVALHVRAPGGTVTVHAAETTSTTIELTPLNPAGEEAVERVTVEHRRDVVVVNVPRNRSGFLRSGPSVAVEVTVPSGSTLDVKAESADVRALGTWADASCQTGSGDVELDTVSGNARLRTGSGTVNANRVAGALQASTGSGDVNVDESGRSTSVTVGSGDISIGRLSGEVVTKTGSGDLEVGLLDGTLVTKTGSGSLTVRRAATGSLKASGASGDITVGVPEGTAAWLDVSTLTGKVRQDLGEGTPPKDGQPTVEITAHTVSGDVHVHRA